MDQNNKQRGNIFSANDTLDINELASLNDDISPEFIEQLQNQVAQNASAFIGKPTSEKEMDNSNEDTELFEEIQEPQPSVNEQKISENVEESFIKKNQTNLEKQIDNNTTTEPMPVEETITVKQDTTSVINNAEPKIENLTSGNIIEKPISQNQIEYNKSLDFIDDNTKYAKYVIYVDPENTEFIESLTVKERKNLINRILREQDDIALTKKRFKLIQTVLKHAIIAIITFAITIPIVYWTINASLEASINNYKRSKTIFKTLYREKGKIKKQNLY